MKKQITLLITLALLTSPALAANKASKRVPPKYPGGCRELGAEFHGGLLVLRPSYQTGEQKTLYLIHNKSLQPIQMDSLKDPTKYFEATYPNKLQANQWGAFAMDKDEIKFGCTTEDGQAADCATALELCQYNNVKFGAHNGGNYWVVSSGTQNDAKYGSIRNGILLRW